ncbi:P-loop NTPase fold protein [Verminephrobacter aporrectodeae]|uniref:P-loop NTPase fold protein n=1 Tax=Verminephrobacter aporrectodeae TaxID=1110389 RepID=UPI002244AE4E|nr:P-loop NTPase fold protein [Verminephrobacter aporrectodeae]
MNELGQPLIIIIDDLDRLPPEEIRSMIQTVKAVLDFPRTLYLLAYDRSIVARALGSNNEEDGLRYLEKIVQVAYPIPPLSQQQRRKFAEEKIKHLLSGLKIILRPFEEEESLYERAIDQVASLSRHMRDIVRIVNRLSLILPIIYQEVNVADAIVFEALSQRSPELRKEICNNPLHFCGRPFPDGISGDDISTEEWTRKEDELALTKKAQRNGDSHWAEFLPKGKERKVADSACQFLFSSSSDSPSIYGLRMADPGRMARYLRCTTIDGVPDAEKIHEILSDPVKLEQALSVSDNKEISSLLGWLSAYIPSCSTLNIEGCIEKLIDKSQLVAGFETSHRIISKAISETMCEFLKHAARTLDERERERCFLNIVEGASIHVSAYIILIEERNENHPLSKDNAFLKDSIKKLIARAREAIKGGLDGELLHYVLYRISDFQNGSRDEVHTITSEMCGTDDGLARFLSYFNYLKTNNLLETHSLDFDLIKNPKDLAKRIENSDLNEQYSWLIKPLAEWKIGQKGI